MDQFSCPDAMFLRKFSQRGLRRSHIERLDIRENVVQFAEARRKVIIFRMLSHRLSFVLDGNIIDEVVRHLIGHLAERARALLMQLDEREEFVGGRWYPQKREQMRV